MHPLRPWGSLGRHQHSGCLREPSAAAPHSKCPRELGAGLAVSSPAVVMPLVTSAIADTDNAPHSSAASSTIEQLIWVEKLRREPAPALRSS